VSALVRSVAWDDTRIELHNLDAVERRVLVTAGALSEHRIDTVHTGSTVEPVVDGRCVDVVLPGGTQVVFSLSMTPRCHEPSYAAPWDIASAAHQTTRA